MSPHIDLPHGDGLPHVDVPAHVDGLPHVDVPAHVDLAPAHVDGAPHIDLAPLHIDGIPHVDLAPPHVDLPHVDGLPHVDIPVPHVDLPAPPGAADMAGILGLVTAVLNGAQQSVSALTGLIASLVALSTQAAAGVRDEISHLRDLIASSNPFANLTPVDPSQVLKDVAAGITAAEHVLNAQNLFIAGGKVDTNLSVKGPGNTLGGTTTVSLDLKPRILPTPPAQPTPPDHVKPVKP